MNCREFEERLEMLLDGGLDPMSLGACMRHARACSACGELLEAVGGANSAATEPLPEALTVSILEHTSGCTCRQARPLLPAHVDRESGADEAELIEMHLQACDDCRQLTSILVALRHELPLLAERPIDNRFTDDVLAATLPLATRVNRWWSSRWSSWVHRPRFAMEAAYVGLLLLMLVFGAFSAPLAALPQQGLRLVQPDDGSASIWAAADEELETFWEWVASLFERVEGKSTEVSS